MSTPQNVRTLTVDEMEAVAGGNAFLVGLFGTLAVATTAVIAIGSRSMGDIQQPSSSCETSEGHASESGPWTETTNKE